ncbi:MAG TPA: transcriptional regulator [Micropruina sp.]|nr:transcriptional regulator [Micropruina sp.]
MIDDNLHSPVRFAIMASLVGLDKAEFSFVRDAIGSSDSVLSKQASGLEALGYLKITKGHVGKRPRTWFSLTTVGRRAFTGHLNALRALADAAARYDSQLPT